MADPTKDRKFRVLYIATHPIQYLAPVLRQMASDPRLEMLVAYCSLQGVEAGIDPGFGVEVKWDVPLLNGYPWVQLPNRSLRPGAGRFFGLINPGLWKLVRTGNCDAVITQTGHYCLAYWILVVAAKLSQTPVIFCTDASTLRPFDTKRWKSLVKPLVVPEVFRVNEIIAADSTAGCELFRSMGIPAKRIVLAPFVVDNEWWTQQAFKVDRGTIRAKWGVPEQSPVVLFCAKVQPWKRPFDLLQAFAKAGKANSFLVFAGDGPLRTDVLADLHFAPTPHAAQNLFGEGIPSEHVFVTGNTVVDAVQSILRQPIELPVPRLKSWRRKLVVVTAHRRESFGEPLEQICNAICRLDDSDSELMVVFPVHRNPAVSAKVNGLLSGHSRIALVDPLPYPEFVHLLKRADLILTDSGGIQEEAPTIGTRVLVIREVTERPEAVESGWAELVGTATETILARAQAWLKNGRGTLPSPAANPFGDGRAGQRIAEVLKSYTSGSVETYGSRPRGMENDPG